MTVSSVLKYLSLIVPDSGKKNQGRLHDALAN